MIVNAKETAAPHDMKPAVVVDLQPAERRQVVAIEPSYHGEQLIPTEGFQLLDGRIIFAEQIEVAFKDPGITLRQRPRICCIARLLRGENVAFERRIELFVTRIAAKTER